MNIVQQKIDTLIQLCKQHGVESLYLFGSTLTDKFTATSDVDFLVAFGNVDSYHYFDNYMDFKENLEKLLNHPVDLVEEKAIKNPILRRSIDNNKQLIYGRAS